jgi:hypothetical protein
VVVSTLKIVFLTALPPSNLIIIIIIACGVLKLEIAVCYTQRHRYHSSFA